MTQKEQIEEYKELVRVMKLKIKDLELQVELYKQTEKQLYDRIVNAMKCLADKTYNP